MQQAYLEQWNASSRARDAANRLNKAQTEIG